MKTLSIVILTITINLISNAFAQDTGYEVYLIQKNERLMKQWQNEPSAPKITWATTNVTYSNINTQDKTFKLTGNIVQIQSGRTAILCTFTNIELTINSGEKKFINCGMYVAELYLETSLGKTYMFRSLAIPGADESISTTKTYVPWDEKTAILSDDSWKNNYAEGFINGFKYVQPWDKL